MSIKDYHKRLFLFEKGRLRPGSRNNVPLFLKFLTHANITPMVNLEKKEVGVKVDL